MITESDDRSSYDEFLGMTFGQMMDSLSDEIPEKEVMVFEDQRITYSEFRENIRRMSMALKRIGVQKGDRVGVLFQNCPEFFYVQQAILYIGGIFISLSTRYRKFEITYMMKHAGAKFIFCVDEYMGTSFVDLLEGIRPELPEMETIIIKGQNTPVWAKSYQEVFDLGKEIDEKVLMADLPEANEICSILYTSGSTGTPKGVMHTHHSIMWDSTRVCERLRIGPDDVFLMMLPCSHIFASFVLYTNAVMGRSKIAIMETFEPGEALRLQEAEKVSVLYGVPTMFTLMLNHPDFERSDIALVEGVQHVAVVGVPNRRLGEKICACIVPRPGHRLHTGEIIQFCKENLANFKVPDFIEIMETFPMTTTEKIQKFKIKELMGEKYQDA